MNTQDLLFFLRNQLTDVRQSKDILKANTLMMVCSTISDAAYLKQDTRVAWLLEDIECAARDICSGIDCKAGVPTDEEIINATNK